MDYSKLSDFEINSAVHNAKLDQPYSLSFMGNDRIAWKRNNGETIITDKIGYSKNGVLDYCNNAADSWPIITENMIALKPVKLFVGGHRWFASMGDNDLTEKFSDANPLRAAMICYLMMRESER